MNGCLLCRSVLIASLGLTAGLAGGAPLARTGEGRPWIAQRSRPAEPAAAGSPAVVPLCQPAPETKSPSRFETTARLQPPAKPAAAHGRALGPNLIRNGQFEDGIEPWSVGSYHEDPNLNDGKWEITAEGCYAGRCLKLSHGRATWQGAWQTSGRLRTGGTYVLSARFRTAASHHGHINLHDPQWRDAAC